MSRKAGKFFVALLSCAGSVAIAFGVVVGILFVGTSIDAFPKTLAAEFTIVDEEQSSNDETESANEVLSGLIFDLPEKKSDTSKDSIDDFEMTEEEIKELEEKQKKAKEEEEAKKKQAEEEAQAKKQKAEEEAKAAAKKAEWEKYVKNYSVSPLNLAEIELISSSRLTHGDKDYRNQRYIVLHEVEGGQTAKELADSRIDQRTYQSAHFIIDAQGNIVQMVPIDKIAHHAEWGGPGNKDKEYGVGYNDRYGIGDNLVGQPDSPEGYKSYGMNSFSIGIELIRENGQDFTEEQLATLDNLIAALDQSFEGNAGTIIDHKMWDNAQSDMGSDFDEYMANYQSHRNHLGV